MVVPGDEAERSSEAFSRSEEEVVAEVLWITGTASVSSASARLSNARKFSDSGKWWFGEVKTVLRVAIRVI